MSLVRRRVVTHRSWSWWLVATVLGCGWGCGGTALVATEPPVVEQLTAHTVRVAGRDAWAVVDVKFAAANVGQEWLILDVAVTATDRHTARIRRDSVFVRTPAGRRVRLASQAEFVQAFSSLRSRVRQANIVASPLLAYFPRAREGCWFQFFAEPGTSVTFDSVSLNDRRACVERLYFKIDGGVPTGRWMLGIDLDESDLRIPFQL